LLTLACLPHTALRTNLGRLLSIASRVRALAQARFSLDTSWASVGMYRRVLAVSSLRSDRDVRA